MADEKPSQFIDIIQSSIRQYPQHIAIQSKQYDLTYNQLDQAIKLYANHLLEIGIKQGDHIAIYDNKSPQTIIAFFAISLIGAVFIPINPLLKSRQVSHILKDSESKLLITSRLRLNSIELEPDELKVILTEQANDLENKHIPISHWPEISQAISKSIKGHLKPFYKADKLNKLCALFYTSGSTGKAKGVCISHQNLISGTKLVADYCQINHQDKILSLLPYSFDYGFNQICTTLYQGATLVVSEYLLANDIGIAIDKYKVTGLAGVPSLWIQFNKVNFEKYLCKTLRFITNSGGKLPANIIRLISEKLPQVKIYLMYGLTEAFRSTYLAPELALDKIDSIGKALAGEEIYVVDESGKPCEVDQIGELVHRGKLVSMGYWKRPEDNKKRFKELNIKYFNKSNYLSVFSGDYVRKDKEGLFYFINRQDDLIKCSGNRISPTEVEDILYEYTDIIESTVIGVPHEDLGEAIIFICAVTPDYNEKHFIQYCKSKLPNFMQARKIIIEDKLPKSANGKIDRKSLKTKYKTLFIKN
ncbi:MAG: AMP-binding protein [Gammaproteobacteria bacterium]|nr:AMP-binding protein [Gammaproteobacteria bacterium]